MYGVDESFNLSAHETYYCVSGDDTGHAVRGTAKALRELAEKILDTIPEPHPLGDARFITAVPQNGPREPLAKVDQWWYDTNGVAYGDDNVLNLYTDIEIIK